jgi:hypothetical protein
VSSGESQILRSARNFIFCGLSQESEFRENTVLLPTKMRTVNKSIACFVRPHCCGTGQHSSNRHQRPSSVSLVAHIYIFVQLIPHMCSACLESVPLCKCYTTIIAVGRA